MKLTSLQQAVLKQLGYRLSDFVVGNSEVWENLVDIAAHGADTGWTGFTYYYDTVKFTKENRKAIEQLVRDFAVGTGDSPVGFVASFRCLDKEDSAIMEAIGRFIYGGHYRDSKDCDSQTVYNALAWFALEETARALTDL